MSPRDLQGKFTLALGKIGDESGAAGSDRHKPIYRRNPQSAEKQAIKEAANALSALWKVRKFHKP